MSLLLALVLAAPTVVLLPLENRSGIDDARAAATTALQSGLEERGYSVVTGNDVETVLAAERVRYLDSLTPAIVRRIAAATGATTIASAAVYRFAEGANPSVALSVRLIDLNGVATWWNVAALSADDTVGMFGRGRSGSREDLLQRAVDQLLRDAPSPGSTGLPPRRGKPFRQSPPRTYRAAGLEGGAPHRIALLPFDNATDRLEAGRTLTQLLWRRLDQSPAFDVVEPAVVRDALVAEKVRSLRDLDPLALGRLAERLGTPLFLRGTVESWRDESPHGATSPEAACELSLVDVRTARVLWTSHLAREGTDYEFLLRRGAITTAIGLADQLVAEMVDGFEKAEPVRRRSAR